MPHRPPPGEEHHGERGVKTNDSVDDVTKQSGPYNSVPGTPEGSRRPETSAFPSVHHDDADSRRRAGRSIRNAPRAQRCGSETRRPGWAGGHMQATGPNPCSSPNRGSAHAHQHLGRHARTASRLHLATAHGNRGDSVSSRRGSPRDLRGPTAGNAGSGLRVVY